MDKIQKFFLHGTLSGKKLKHRAALLLFGAYWWTNQIGALLLPYVKSVLDVRASVANSWDSFWDNTPSEELIQDPYMAGYLIFVFISLFGGISIVKSIGFAISDIFNKEDETESFSKKLKAYTIILFLSMLLHRILSVLIYQP